MLPDVASCLQWGRFNSSSIFQSSNLTLFSIQSKKRGLHPLHSLYVSQIRFHLKTCKKNRGASQVSYLMIPLFPIPTWSRAGPPFWSAVPKLLFSRTEEWGYRRAAFLFKSFNSQHAPYLISVIDWTLQLIHHNIPKVSLQSFQFDSPCSVNLCDLPLCSTTRLDYKFQNARNTFYIIYHHLVSGLMWGT